MEYYEIDGDDTWLRALGKMINLACAEGEKVRFIIHDEMRVSIGDSNVWTTVARPVAVPVLPGVHEDAGVPGSTPYDNVRKEFVTTCTCGQKFYGMDPDDADAKWGDHREEMDTCEHKADDDPEPGNRCKYCGIPLTWMGPGADDWEGAAYHHG